MLAEVQLCHNVPVVQADTCRRKMHLWAWWSAAGWELLCLEVPLLLKSHCKKEAPRSGPALGQEAGEWLICERTLTSQGVCFRLKGSSMGTLAALCHGHCCLNAFLAFTYSDFCFPSGKEVSSVSLLPAQTGKRPYVHIRQLYQYHSFILIYFSLTLHYSLLTSVSQPLYCYYSIFNTKPWNIEICQTNSILISTLERFMVL